MMSQRMSVWEATSCGNQSSACSLNNSIISCRVQTIIPALLAKHKRLQEYLIHNRLPHITKTSINTY